METEVFLSSNLKRRCLFERPLIASFLLAAAIGGCDLHFGVSGDTPGLSRVDGVKDRGKITIVASVSEYKSEAAYDDFADGTSAAYDVSIIKIIEPKKYEGIELGVWHDVPASPGSVWFKTGSIYLFELDEEIIGKQGITVNSESLTVVREAEK